VRGILADAAIELLNRSELDCKFYIMGKIRNNEFVDGPRDN
jgi:hypothetical protein